MKNYKKILVLLLFAIAIIGILAPVNAKLDTSVETDTKKTVNGKSEVRLVVFSNINNVKLNKAEFNKVNKIVLSIKGFKSKTFKKSAKGFYNDGSDGSYFYTTFAVKGKTFNKDYSVKLYNKKGNLIKNIKGKVSFWDRYNQKI